MSYSLRNTVLILIGLFFCSVSFAYDSVAEEPIDLNELETRSVSNLDLASKVFVYFDDRLELSVDNVLQKQSSVPWAINSEAKLNYGFQEQPLWIKGSLSNTSSQMGSYLLVVESPTLDKLDIVWVKDGERVPVGAVSTGNARPFESRAIENRHFLFPFLVEPRSDLVFFLRVEEAGSMQVPLSIWKPQEYFEQYQYDLAKYSIYFGILLTLALYNLFLWISIKSRGHAYYVVYILAMIFIQASQTGIGSQFIWPGFPEIASLVVQLSVPIALIFAALFGIHTLNLLPNEKIWLTNVGVAVVSSVLILLIPILDVALHLQICVILGVLGSLIFLATGLLRWKHGDQATRLFAVAWCALLFGTIIYGSTKLGLLPVNAITNNIMWIGSAVEGILLSFSVGARINQVQQEKASLETEQMQSRLRNMELESIAGQAEAENRAKGEFIATFSHEVRTPINGVLGMADLLSDTQLNEEQREFIGVIQYSGKTLLNLMNDVLDYSKLEAGKMDVESIETDLNELIEASLSLFTVQARELGLDLEMKLLNKVPRYIKTDPVRLNQVLNNLLANALKFTEQGQVTLTVSADSAMEVLRFEVKDSGIGLTDDQQELLFTSFQQADKSTTRKYGGTGLGLAICKRLITLMDGTIGVKSALGRGSLFWFEIPLVRVPASQITSFIEVHERENNVQLNDLHVLAAEDNHVNQMVLGRYLEKMGCKVTFTENGEDVCRVYSEAPNDFSVILMDYEMPVLDGMKASQRIRDWERTHQLTSTPIIMLTAHSMPNTLAKLKASVVNDVLIKPVERKSLQELLMRYSKQNEFLSF